MRTFVVTSKNLKKDIQMSVGDVDRIFMPPFEAFGTSIQFKIRDSKKCLYLSDYSYNKWGTELSKFVGQKIKKCSIGIEITDESWELMLQIKSEMVTEQKELINLHKKEAAEQSTWYEMYSFLDWGDYSINNEREVIVYRNPMEKWGENKKMRVKTYKLWNDSVGIHTKNWDIDFKENGGGGEITSVKITEDIALKWIAISNEAIRKEQEKKDIDAAKNKERIESQKAERLAKFEKAKESGTPVLLYSVFLTYNDIPLKYRDDESDMGHLETFAMPDGSIKEKFIHAY